MTGHRRIAATVAAALGSCVVLLGTGPAGAQDGGTTVEDPVGITTTTLPEDDSELGRIIPLPNSGREPTSPGERGGWQQVTLFFAICAVIVGIGVYLWWRSRRSRAQLRARGLDRVEWARSHGGDVRDDP
jgi:hypothetical protein